MRVARGMGLMVVVAAVLGFGGAAQAGVFPDLPGSRMLEEATTGAGPDTSSSSSAPAPQSGAASAPAPDPVSITKAAVGAEQIEVVTSLPGGGGLPMLKDIAPASTARTNALLAFLAVFGTVLWARFLYRLNDLGRRPV